MPAPRRCVQRRSPPRGAWKIGLLPGGNSPANKCSVEILDEGTWAQELPENGTCIPGIEDGLVILQELYESLSSRALVICGAAYISCHLEGH